MNRKFIVLIISVFSLNAAAQTATTNVSYSKGVFTTTVSISAAASQEAMRSTVDKFIHQYKNNLPALFPWALQGINLQGEKDGFIVFNVKKHTLDGALVRGVMDMTVVPLGRKYTDVHYSVAVKKTKDTAEEIAISYEMTDCEEVIKYALATFSITHNAEGNRMLITLVANVQLSKFYNTVTTKKMYAEGMTWRFVRFLENLAKDAAQ